MALYIDFKKVFDFLQYPVLLQKLKSLHIGPDALGWIEDYLTDRKQSTCANGVTSLPSGVKQRVPQGSILGPLLYIIYASDIPGYIKKSKVTFYADDTVLYSNDKDVNVALQHIQEDLNNLTKWCESNSIHINPLKTKYMIFRNKHVTPNTTLQIVSAKVYQLRKIRHLLTKKAALMIYKNMILPILEYGDIFMMSATKKTGKNSTLQNKVLKCAIGRDNRYSTNKLHSEAKLMKLKYRRKMHLLQHMFHVSHKPNFKGWKTRTCRATRSSKKKLINIRKPNTTKFQRSLTYRGPKLWNSLPKYIIAQEDFGPFKHHLDFHITGLAKDKGNQ